MKSGLLHAHELHTLRRVSSHVSYVRPCLIELAKFNSKKSEIKLASDWPDKAILIFWKFGLWARSLGWLSVWFYEYRFGRYEAPALSNRRIHRPGVELAAAAGITSDRTRWFWKGLTQSVRTWKAREANVPYDGFFSIESAVEIPLMLQARTWPSPRL